MKKLLIILGILFTFDVYALEPSEDATLKYIRVNSKDVQCSGYDCSIEIDSSSATITYATNSATATVDRYNNLTVTANSGVFDPLKITVTSEDKVHQNVYTLNIIKYVKSSDNTLKELALNDKKIELDKDRYNYNAQVDFDVDEIKVKATPHHNKAKVTSDDTFEFDIESSSTVINVTVKAEDGSNKTYSIVIQRNARPDSSLKSLTIDAGKIEFSKDIFEYSFAVEYGVTKLKIEALANVNDAKVTINNKELEVGENKIDIVVTNGKAKDTYVLNVTRKPNLDKSQANLKELTIEEYPKLNFESNVLEYDLVFQKIPEKLTINASAILEDATIEVIGNEALKDGNIVTIKITATENKIEREYTIKINQFKEVNNSKLDVIIALIFVSLMTIMMFLLEYKSNKKKINRIIKTKIKKQNNDKKIKESEKIQKKEVKKEEKENKSSLEGVKTKPKKNDDDEIELL